MTMKMLPILVLCISLPAMAQEQQDENTVAPPPCSARPYHQFDFWIGDWNVTENGQMAGTNSIEPILGGCALLENWQGSGPGGIRGSSFNIYDQARDQWHQTWVDASGTLLQLDGGWHGGSMILQGERPSADGNGTTTHRITWTPLGDGTVRQLWDASRDGQTWTVLFDGLYQKVTVN
jgi:hypothetical protein